MSLNTDMKNKHLGFSEVDHDKFHDLVYDEGICQMINDADDAQAFSSELEKITEKIVNYFDEIGFNTNSYDRQKFPLYSLEWVDPVIGHKCTKLIYFKYYRILAFNPEMTIGLVKHLRRECDCDFFIEFDWSFMLPIKTLRISLLGNMVYVFSSEESLVNNIELWVREINQDLS
jgi:hypothetical protein